MDVLLINNQQVTEILRMDACIELMSETLKTLAKGESLQPLRSGMWLPDKRGLLGMMPGYANDKNVMGIKVVSVFPGNGSVGLSSHQGAVMLFEGNTGQLYAIVDGDAITAIRTAAVSAVATRLFARKDAKELIILGSGEQARKHLEAILPVRDITHVKVWSRNHENAQLFVQNESRKYNNVTIEAIESVQEAVSKADIICTTTSSKEPILKSDWVPDGVHINAVGSCTRGARELDSDLVARSKFYTDWRESLLNESDDFLVPFQEGLFGEEHLKGELGDVLLERATGRETEKEVTLFKSLGLAVEDIAACHYIHEKATKQQLGTQLNI